MPPVLTVDVFPLWHYIYIKLADSEVYRFYYTDFTHSFSLQLRLACSILPIMVNLHARAGVSTVQPPLSQAVGYVVVVVIGIIVALCKCCRTGKNGIRT